jgi:hypothetical protein
LSSSSVVFLGRGLVSLYYPLFKKCLSLSIRTSCVVLWKKNRCASGWRFVARQFVGALLGIFTASKRWYSGVLGFVWRPESLLSVLLLPSSDLLGFWSSSSLLRFASSSSAAFLSRSWFWAWLGVLRRLLGVPSMFLGSRSAWHVIVSS